MPLLLAKSWEQIVAQSNRRSSDVVGRLSRTSHSYERVRVLQAFDDDVLPGHVRDEFAMVFVVGAVDIDAA